MIVSLKYSLLVRYLDGSELSHPLNRPITKLGRFPGNDIILPQDGVSRFHAEIHIDSKGTVSIVDLGSANGTLVAGRRVNGRADIGMQDKVQIVGFALALRPLDQPPSDIPPNMQTGHAIRSENRRLVVPQESEAADFQFDIRTGTIGLDELQRNPTLSSLSGRESAATSDLKNLELLYEVGVSLAGSQSTDEVTASAIQLLFRIENVHRATVMLWDEEREAFTSDGLHTRGTASVGLLSQSSDVAKMVMSRTILQRVRQYNRPMLIRDATHEAKLLGSASIILAGIRAAFCSPLSFHGQFIGIVYADNRSVRDAFSEADFRTLTAIAAQTGLAMANAVAKQRLKHREAERQALRLYMPSQVADAILNAGGSFQLAGVTQTVTVLFADIRGFTTLSQNIEAKELVQMLSEFFTAMSTIILACNGTLDKFIGDCVMALFGAPVQSTEAPRDALRAAIGMQREMDKLNTDRAARGLATFQIGVGLHCGPAVVGNIGSADRVQYTAIGDTVNVASRLCGKASASQIIVSQDFTNSVPDLLGFEHLGEVELKGRTAKMNIYSADRVEIGEVLPVEVVARTNVGFI